MNENYPELSSGEKALVVFLRVFCSFAAMFLLVFLPWSGYWSNPEGFYKVYVVVMPALTLFLLISCVYLSWALESSVFAVQLALFIHGLFAVIIGAALLVILFQTLSSIDDLFKNFDQWIGMIGLTAFLLVLLVLIGLSGRVLARIIQRSKDNSMGSIKSRPNTAS